MIIFYYRTWSNLRCSGIANKGHHKPYGEFITTLERIKGGQLEYKLRKMDSIDELGKAKFVIENFKYEALEDITVEKEISFLNFLSSDWEMGLSVAIDFTGSNGTITSKSSLHYLNPTGEPNQYEKALTAVGSVLVNYDSDLCFPAFGFGGIPNFLDSKKVSHCFNLNGTKNPECESISGLMEAYKFSLNNVDLYAPTYFAPCLQRFLNLVLECKNNQTYHIMMILTDGVVDDLQETKDVIVAASKLPISIIIIGVGEHDFEEMDELNHEKNPIIDSNGNSINRDILHFIKFRDHAEKSQQKLSEEILMKIPNQVVEYLKVNKVKL